MFFVPRRCTTCRGNALHAATIFAPRQSSSCCGKALFAAAKLFVPWQSSLCCSKALRAAPRNDAPWHCMASFSRVAAHVVARNDVPQHRTAFRTIVSSCLGKKRPAAAFRSMSCHAAPLFFVPWPSSSCRSMFICDTTRNDAPQHSMLLFFVPQQEMMCCCILWHCTSW